MSDRFDSLMLDLYSDDESARRFAVEDLGELRDPRAVRPLVSALADASIAVREAVVESLSRIGGAETAAALLPCLRSEDPPVRNAACVVLVNLGAAAVPALNPLLKDDDHDVRKLVVDVLAQIASPAATEALLGALNDVNVNVAAAAAEALGRVGCRQAVAAMVDSLKANNWLRCAVARSLGLIGGPEARRALGELIGDEDEMVCFTAVQSLGAAGDESSLQYLLYLLKHANAMIVNATIVAIQAIIDRLDPTVWREIRAAIELEPVIHLTRHAQPRMRASGIDLLGKLGDAGALSPLADALVAAENRDDERIRELARRAILSIAPQDVRPLVTLLGRDGLSPEGACELIDVLGRLGRPEAFDAVAARLSDDDVIVRRVAARVLAGLDGERALQPLGRALSDADGHVRAGAARGLGALLADRSVAALTALLGDDQAEARQAAAWAIGHIGGPATAAALNGLRGLLVDRHGDVREAAAKALGRIGDDFALGAIEELLGSTDPGTRVLAVRGLAEAPRSARAIDRLRCAVGDGSPAVFGEVLRALADREDSAIATAVLARLNDAEPGVRTAAARYLAARRPGPWASTLPGAFERETDPQVRYELSRVLGRLKPPGALAALLAALEAPDADPFVVLGAVEALGALGDEQAREALISWSGNADEEISAAASRALAAMDRSTPALLGESR